MKKEYGNILKQVFWEGFFKGVIIAYIISITGIVIYLILR